MTKEQLWTCDRCGVQTLESNMDEVWQPYQIGVENGQLCPDCFGLIEGAMHDLLETDNRNND
jgi:hypothetical protein